VLHGLSHARVRPDDTVVLLGGGAIALLYLLVLRARGVARVIIVARSAARAAQARALGAEVVPSAVETALEPILTLTARRGADLVVECTGAVGVWEAAPGLARRGGQVVLFGGCSVGSSVRFDTARLHYDQVAIASPFHFTPRDVRAAYELLGDARFGGGALVTDELPLERLEEALTRHQSGEGAKFAIRPAPG
jgi:L-iditol 2-dehydrogenase